MSTDHASMISRLRPFLPDRGAVTIFSADWCPFCTSLRADLTAARIAFREVMIEQDAVAEQLAAEINGGDWIIPTVIHADGTAQVNPSPDEVRAELDRLTDA